MTTTPSEKKDGGDRPRTVELRDARALRALAHPTRLRLLGLLRLQGPLTATQAARLLDETPQRCTFHLRQLARYGLAEEAGGGHGRERPWRATALFTEVPNVLSGADAAAAAGLLEAVIAEQQFQRVREWIERKSSEPVKWQEAAHFGDAALYLTPDELAELGRKVLELSRPFIDRLERPELRPDGSRLVMFMEFAFPMREADGSTPI